MKATLRGRALSAALVGAVAVTAFATAVPAQADNSYDFASASNASDPSVYRCHNPNGAGLGWCMVTSQDLDDPPIGTVGGADYNPYPMRRTLTFFSTDGIDWNAPKIGTDEKLLRWYDSKGKAHTVDGTRHQWAPAVRYLQTPGGRAEWPIDNYFMYTPNLWDKKDRLSSRIWVTYSNNALTGFGDTEIHNDPAGRKQIPIEGIPTQDEIDKFIGTTPLYMSDPDVFTDSAASDYYTLGYFQQDWLLWADGDNGTCGGISMRHLANQWTVEKFSHPNQAYLTINGLNTGPQALGTCTKTYNNKTTTIDRPYIEGASLFHSNHWTASRTSEGLPGPYVLVFAAKPSSVPAPCKSTYGETNTANEVIGYATANTVTGPYTYKGIIMCGSTTEWTNQATIEQVQATDGTSRLVMIYHDGPKDGNRNRQLHAECLYAVNGEFIKTMRSSDGVATVGGDRNWCLKQSDVFALKSASADKFVSVTSSGLVANATYIGPYEQFAKEGNGSEILFNSRRTGRYVDTDSSPLNANDIVGDTRFSFENIAGTKYRIKDEYGFYVRTQTNGQVVSGSKNPSSTDTSYMFWLETLSN